jgi:hypothetical protein
MSRLWLQRLRLRRLRLRRLGRLWFRRLLLVVGHLPFLLIRGAPTSNGGDAFGFLTFTRSGDPPGVRKAPLTSSI